MPMVLALGHCESHTATPTPERITEGIKSLAGVIKTEMESRQIN